MRDKVESEFIAGAFRSKIESEHEQFYSEMSVKEKSEIYHSCNKIQFWESLYEYFMISEVNERWMEICSGQDDLIGALWLLYLKREEFKVDTWEGIEELLGAFAKTPLPF